MNPSARIQATIELWEKIQSAGVPMDTLCGDYFRVRRYIGSSDRAAIVERVYSMMRSYARNGWWLERCATADTARNRVLVDLAVREGLPKPHITDLFHDGRHAPAPLDDAETALLSQLVKQPLEHADMPERVLAECPEAAEAPLRALFGDHFLEEMRAMQHPATLDLRVNTLRCPREGAQLSLARQDVIVTPTPLSPVGLRATEKVFLSKTKALVDGLVDIQDEGSQLIALICGAKPGMQVLDACAGAGGKTLALAAAMQNKGRIVAMDSDAGRLQKGKPRYVRAGIHNIETRPLSDEQNRKWLRRQKQTFDVVLIDAPCSSSGTWRRNPDLRWRALGPTRSNIIELQSDILDKFEKCVKIGGHLVYATCSLYRDENEEQVTQFLARTPGFELVPVHEAWAKADLPLPCPLPDTGPMMRLSPAKSGTDGFFAAVLRRVA